MSYEKVLGEVVRDIRLRAGLTHDACGEVINATHLRQIEKGLAAVRIDTLVALCEVLGVSPSQLLLVVEARSVGEEVEGRLAVNNKQIRALLEAGRFEPVSPEDAARGIRGLKADATCNETRRLQAEGLSKAEIARQLSVTVRTVERYWLKPVAQE
ncbi:transcriptional regulator [Pseudomonas benzenivorans]|uniref:Transcriptional regulator n=1 Tax=Pseudomonas benzenivorans TaxID=556533 RepID=A0ABZ0PU35_9PSED|nr:transcriptional regulator [Pseudomonas benzenivorans]WPC04692.1 transcriptional regulator [Pseudomonas benzenivorans]